jgi:hypothetical protein
MAATCFLLCNCHLLDDFLHSCMYKAMICASKVPIAYSFLDVLCGKLVLNCQVSGCNYSIMGALFTFLGFSSIFELNTGVMQQHSGLWHCRHVTLLQLLNVKCCYYLTWDYCYDACVTMY